MHVSDISRRLMLVIGAVLLVIGGLAGSAFAGVLSPAPAAAGAPSAPAGASAAGATVLRPCNIYAIGGTPCVAAYSTVRALYLGYHGPLYRVTRVSDGREHRHRRAVAWRLRRRGRAERVLRGNRVHHHPAVRPEP